MSSIDPAALWQGDDGYRVRFVLTLSDDEAAGLPVAPWERLTDPAARIEALRRDAAAGPAGLRARTFCAEVDRIRWGLPNRWRQFMVAEATAPVLAAQDHAALHTAAAEILRLVEAGLLDVAGRDALIDLWKQRWTALEGASPRPPAAPDRPDDSAPLLADAGARSEPHASPPDLRPDDFLLPPAGDQLALV